MAGNQEESIYDWVEQDEVTVTKPAMYRSRYKATDTRKLAGSTFKVKQGNHGTFGKKNNRPNQNEFLKSKRDRGVASNQIPTKFNRTLAVSRKPNVPKRTEKPVMGLKTTKNFVVSNAVENILTVASKAPKKKTNYMKKSDYGKVPQYLKHVKNDIEEEMRVIEEYFTEQKSGFQEQGQILSKAERQQLVAKLKQKWDATNKKYQKITHVVKLDTIGKIKRKEAFERELDQLVKDIQLLSQKRPIRIVN